VGNDVSVDNGTFLMTDFVNLKIKLTQSFKSVNRARICVRVFIEISNHICMSICVYIYKKNNRPFWRRQ
jgi:hypothetical protein